MLQPMTHPEIVREYFLSNGFSEKDEMRVEDDKIYQIICAEYSGEVTVCADPCELSFGRINIERGGELLERSLERAREVYVKRAQGKALAEDADDSTERAMLESIEKILKEKRHGN